MAANRTINYWHQVSDIPSDATSGPGSFEFNCPPTALPRAHSPVADIPMSMYHLGEGLERQCVHRERDCDCQVGRK